MNVLLHDAMCFQDTITSWIHQAKDYEKEVSFWTFIEFISFWLWTQVTYLNKAALNTDFIQAPSNLATDEEAEALSGLWSSSASKKAGVSRSCLPWRPLSIVHASNGGWSKVCVYSPNRLWKEGCSTCHYTNKQTNLWFYRKHFLVSTRQVSCQEQALPVLKSISTHKNNQLPIYIIEKWRDSELNMKNFTTLRWLLLAF